MHSITKKVLLSLIVSTFLVLSLVYFVSYAIQSSTESENWNKSVETLDKQVQVILQEPTFAYDKSLIQSLITALAADIRVDGIVTYDHRGQVLGKVGTLQSDTGLTKKNLPILWTDNEKIGSVDILLNDSLSQGRLSSAITDKIIGLVVSIVLLCFVLLFVLRKIVVKPIEQVSNVLEDIARGGGDLTQRIPYQSSDEIGSLANNFNDFIGTVQNIVRELAGATSELAGVNERVTHSSQMTHRNTELQQSQTSDALEHLTQLTSATNEIASNAELTASNTKNAHQLSSEGQSQMEANMQQVNTLVDELDNTSNVVTELRTASNDIGSVLDVIKSIAEQTNLLALNAAIEAARAGEYGRGFAVVADEVRALASKTHQSTTEIEGIIDSLQAKAQESFQATHRSKELAGVAIESTTSTRNLLNEIVEQMDGINDMNNHIASASEEQSHVTSVVTDGMQSLHSGASELASQARQLEEATVEMANVEKKLVEQIARFNY